MAGVVGSNQDVGGFIFDPSLDQTKQYIKEVGGNPALQKARLHAVGGYRTVKIPTANVLTLNTTPIQIVPAAGAGTVIIPTMMVASLVFNSIAYTANAAGVSLIYGANGAGVSTLFTLSQAFIQSASGTNVQVVNHPSAATYLPASTDFNVPLTLIAGTANPAAGDSDLWVRVYFRVLTVPFAANQNP